MALRITGIDWDALFNANGRPLTIGIEGFMVGVKMEEKQIKKGEDLAIRIKVLRIGTRHSETRLALKCNAILAGLVSPEPYEKEGEKKEKIYGELEIV